MYDMLYDVTERSHIHFIGCASESARYDIAVVFTQYFLGKPLVVCMQTGRSTLLCEEDLSDLQLLRQLFQLRGNEEAEELALLLTHHLPRMSGEDPC